MSEHRRYLLRLAPLGLLATIGCVATRNDLRVLQSDLATYRAEAAQADSVRRRQDEQLLAIVRTVSDSLREASARMATFKTDVDQALFSTNQQLLQIQELTGQSQRRLQELRAEMETRGASTVGAPPGSSAPARPPTPPGPNQLFQLSLDQLRRGSSGAARSGFADLLRQYPTSDLAGDAQFYVAESYAAEANVAAADSAYVTVFTNYPTTTRAATAMYKHALSLDVAGRTDDARTALNDVVRKYPRSDEAELARERLRAPR